MKLYVSPVIPVFILVSLIGGYLGNKMLGVQAMSHQIHGFVALAGILGFLVFIALILNHVKKRKSRSRQ